MPDNPVPPEVRLFIFDCIESVAHLEALLLLKDTPEQDWDVSSLARRLYIGHAEATAILEHLTTCELAQRSGAGFRHPRLGLKVVPRFVAEPECDLVAQGQHLI